MRYGCVAIVGILATLACGDSATREQTRVAATQPAAAEQVATQHRVDEVSVSGSPGAYTFSVTVSSPDTGCDSFADWWEVVSEDGRLLHRRILLHSHVDEQPFTRSGGPVPLSSDEVAVVRVHMNTAGYSRDAVRLTPEGSTERVRVPLGFAAEVESQEPQPGDCAF
jgi:hypothetical protein